MRHRLLLGLVALVALVALLVVSCAKATPTPTPKPTPTPTATPTKAAATPTPTPAGQQVEGKVVFATPVLDAMVGDPAVAPYRNWEQSAVLGITEALFVMDESGDPMAPYLAESWQVAPDGKKATIKVKKGIPWNTPPLPEAAGKNFGEFTAEDPVWFLNHNNARTNKESTSGDAGDLAAVFGEARVIDKYTFEIDIVSPVFYGLVLSEFGVLGAEPSIRSKKVAETMSPDFVRDWPVGTGPYVIKEWLPNDRGVIESVPNHWSHKGRRVKEIVRLQVPEATGAVAMLKAGELDIADMDFTVRLDAAKADPKLKVLNTMRGGYVGVSVIYSGNLWEEVHAIDGTPLEPWKSPALSQDYPWIGNPWGDKSAYTDTDNPAGMSDMEQARLVRWALSYAIDREALSEKVMGGMGLPLYSEYMGPEYPGWDASRTVTYSGLQSIFSEHGWTDIPEAKVAPAAAIKDKAWPWKVPHDPSYAGQLLDMAGYPLKGGVRFSLSMNAYACEIGQSCLVVADAVNTMWQDIGVRAEITKEDYGAVISPRMRKREQALPTVKNGDVHSNVWPIDWPYPPVDSSLSRPGWGVGFESKFLSGMHLKIRKSQDKDSRIKWHLQTVDYIMYWQLYNGIIQQPKSLLVRADKIASWEPRPRHYANWQLPQFIKLIGW